MPQIKLHLFGPPRLDVADQPVNLSLRKATALMGYLGATDQPHSRDALATLFWPEANQRGARSSLRRLIYDIGQRVEADLLFAAPETIGFDPKANIWVDVQEFKAQVNTGLAQPPQIEMLSTAANLYVDDFMAGFTLNKCPEFDDWQFFQREELRQMLAQVLVQLITVQELEQSYEAALPLARRWLALDPLHEPAHRTLMRLYALANQQTAAVRQFEECVRILERELGVPPEESTKDLFEAIRRRQTSLIVEATLAENVSKRGSSSLGLQQGDSTPSPTATDAQLSKQNLPIPPTPFIGRQQEIAEIIQRITDPACRLLTLVGPGGIGKTRLALESAKRLADSTTSDQNYFRDGIYFVPLQPIESSSHIASAIADVIHYQFSESKPLIDQLLIWLANKSILLVLDNFEHLLDDVGLLSEIQSSAPNIKLLVTSRDALPLPEAWFHPVAGMFFPGTDLEEDKSTIEYDAIQLFDQNAQRNQIGYVLETELTHVARICRLVEGMPLALELAAAWLKVLSTHEIADEIAQSLDLLTAQNQHIPARHRSIRVIFEQTWTRLSLDEQALLKRLSIFRGGCLRESAEAIVDASLPLLAALVEKALVYRNASGRYEVHELIRQFAAERLQTMPKTYDDLRHRHSKYFAFMLHQQEEILKGKAPQRAVDSIVADLDNVRLGWRWAARNQDFPTLDNYLESLFLFYELRGLLQEGVEAFRFAIAQFPGSNGQDLDVARQNILGQLYSRCGGLEIRLGQYDEGIALMQQGEQILRRLTPESNRELARVLSHLGQEIHRQGHYQTARRHLQESFELSTKAGDEWMKGVTLLRLGQLAEFQGEYIEAEPYFQQSVDLFQRLGEQRYRAFSLNNQGRVAYAMGEYGRARHLITTALQIREALSDQIGIAYSHLDLGKLETLIGNYSNAQTFITHALDISEMLGERDLVARCLNAMGVVARLLKDFPRAEALHNQSYTTYMEINVQLDIPSILTNLGAVALYRGNYPQAKKSLQESLQLSLNNDNKSVAASTLRYLGHLDMILSKNNEDQQSVHHYTQALDIAIEINAVPIILDVFGGLAQRLLQKAEFDQAADLLTLIARHPSTAGDTRAYCHGMMQEMDLAIPATPDEGVEIGQEAPNWRSLVEAYF